MRSRFLAKFQIFTYRAQNATTFTSVLSTVSMVLSRLNPAINSICILQSSVVTTFYELNAFTFRSEYSMLIESCDRLDCVATENHISL